MSVPSRSPSARSRGIGDSDQGANVVPPSAERHAIPVVVPPSPATTPATSTVPLASRANAVNAPPATITGTAKVMPPSRLTASWSPAPPRTRR